MMGSNKGIMIMPASEEELVRTNYYLLSRGKIHTVVYIDMPKGEKQPVIMTNMNFVDKILYRLNFSRSKKETVCVFS